MSRPKYRAPQNNGTAIPNTPSKPSTEVRNFGLLKVRSMKVKQAEAIVFKEIITNNFSKMSNERLIEIIEGNDIDSKRELSKYFAKTNGIYDRSVRYLAGLYRFDSMIYPNLDLDEEVNEATKTKILKRFNQVLEFFDNSTIAQLCRKWAYQICLEGVYYGYICTDISDKLVIQDLPAKYCRSRFLHRGKPLIEFDCQYFDKITNNTIFREKLLNLFPSEIREGYLDFKAGRLPAEDQGDRAGWMLLDADCAFKFNFNEDDNPPFAYAIPELIKLGEVEDLEKEKLVQELQKILVQRFELDKQGQIPFTMPELQQLNQNAIDMVGDAVGVSVLSTVANVTLEDLAPAEGGANRETAAKASVYDSLGISTNLFNTDGNLALEKSVLTDEAFIKTLLLQFENFFNSYLDWKFNRKESKFRMKMLSTTIFNYTELSKEYKELTKIGFSRFLPMVALGHSQKEVTSMAKLEQQIMELDMVMLPPFSSNTMSSDTWNEVKNLQQASMGGQKANPIMRAPESQSASGAEGGRPVKAADQQSEKTIQNKESAN